MRMLLFVTLALLSVTVGLVAWANPAQASIIGFGDFTGFQINKNDNGANPTVNFSPSTIHLTGMADGEARSIFFNTPQTVSSFSASFTFVASTGNTSPVGFAFVLQNDSRGASAVGGFSLGYNGISPSAAIEFNGGNSLPIGLFADGAVANGSNAVSPVDLASGHPIDVAISYNGTILNATLTDTVTSQSSPTASFLISLPTTAYVGLTAGIGPFSGGGRDQAFSNFQFTNVVPEPPAALLFAAGTVGIVVYLRQRRPSGRNIPEAAQS